MAGDSQDENGLNAAKRPEPKPWPSTVAHVSFEVLNVTASNRSVNTSETQQSGPPDRHAKLAVFRI
jgi:hypothetical protein